MHLNLAEKLHIMKITTKLFLLAGLVFFSACKNDKKTDTSGEETTTQVEETVDDFKLAYAILEPRSGSNAIGKAEFTEENGVVTFYSEVSNLSPGMHAVHLHENSDCSADDASSAGGHWNPTFAKHGKWGDPEGYHRGDIGNFEADENGSMIIKFETDQWCIGCDDESKNILGKSIIIHVDPDDYVTQPTGNAGGRLICGGIIE